MNEATLTIVTILTIAGALVGVIVVLTLFFKVIGHFGSKGASNTERLNLRGVIDEQTKVTVHLSTGVTFENVLLIGFTRADDAKQAFPYELTGMTILKHLDGSKTLIQSKLIRMIEVPSMSTDSHGHE